MDETTIQQGIVRIQELAAFVIEEFRPISDIDFGFKRESLAWLEGLVEREPAASLRFESLARRRAVATRDAVARGVGREH
jgi:hypothetical protein